MAEAGPSSGSLTLGEGARPIIAGQTRSADFPATPGAYQESPGNPGSLQWDAFVAECDSAGSSLSWCTYLGGTAKDVAWALAVDPSGAPIVGGETYSTDCASKSFGLFRSNLRDTFPEQ